MVEQNTEWSVALDGGTTNTRARLISGDRVVATARRPVGVRDTVLDPSASPLVAAVRAALGEVLEQAGGPPLTRIVAAGMLSSEVGLSPVPHVVSPAGLDELARGMAVRLLPEVSEVPIGFVPGVRSEAGAGADGWAEADMMRGEECETVGARLLLAPGGSRGGREARPEVFLWPGSHTKLVAVDPAGRIARSHTTLAGEMLSALARHTLLAASLPAGLPDEPDREAMEMGGRLAMREGLGRAAFLVRIAAVSGALDPGRRGAFWLGAVVAEDVGHLSRHPMLAGGVPVRVGGRQPLRSFYAEWLGRLHPGPVTALDDAVAERASAVGALAVARRREELPEAPGG